MAEKEDKLYSIRQQSGNLPERQQRKALQPD